MFWSLLLLVGVVAAIAWIVRGRRPAPPSTPYEDTPVATDWGRQAPTQSQQPGVGGQVMGGLATGLAIGAGAIAAQEIGRHMLGGDHTQHGPDDHGSAAGSDLARDAGLDAIGRDDSASWDDAGASSSDDGGGADGGDGGGGDS